uniref:Caspase recruitment domain family member 9 n=1 Tax=Scleropages formosus TaxID=113540 RepID=A0A8C9RR71_SCLFO
MSSAEDEECWVQLEDYRLLLIKSIEPSRITPYLRQCKVLSGDDEEQIFNDPNLVIRRRKVGVLLDILQRTGRKGYVAFLESLELDYPQVYRKITGKEPARAFSILVDTAGESGLMQFLMSEVTRLQKALEEERRHRQEVSARLVAQEDTIRQQQVRESELRKQQERVCRMREERDRLVEETRYLKDENYNLLREVTRMSEGKNSALMSNRDLQLEIERLKHSLMNAESDSKIQRRHTKTLKNAMEKQPSQDLVLQVERQNDLLTAQVHELESALQMLRSSQPDQEKVNDQTLEHYKHKMQAQNQKLVNNMYILRKQLRNTEDLRDKYLDEKDLLELQCSILQKDAKVYRSRMEDVLKQLDEVIAERDKAICTREAYHLENSRNLQEKDQHRKQIQELGERCDELQVQLFRTQGEVISLETKLRRFTHPCSPIAASDFEDCSVQSWLELKSQTSEEEFKDRSSQVTSEEPSSLTSEEYSECLNSQGDSLLPLQQGIRVTGDQLPNRRPRTRFHFYYRRKYALRSKITSKEHPQLHLDNTSGSDNTDTDGM